MTDTSIRESPPRVFNIPTGIAFVDALAAGLLRQAGGDPLRLAAMTVLLPNRRACRALQEAFLRQAQLGPDRERTASALLLPRLQPIGDVDEDDLAVLAGGALDLPPAIDPLRRQLLLARLVMAGRPRFQPDSEPLRWQDAVRLAADLGRLLDQVETEGCDLADLDKLVTGDLARHWQLTVNFLDILRDAWPAILRDEGAIDAAQRRNLLLRRQRDLWLRQPPAGPVIAAGSTGSIPASADLIATIARLPQGCVVLPGLDRSVDDAVWAKITEDPSHPQFGLALLLKHIGIERNQVDDWSDVTATDVTATDVTATDVTATGVTAADAAKETRRRLIAQALMPADCTDRWSTAAELLDVAEATAAWAPVHRIDCHSRQEEAGVIALILRHHVETPGAQRAALVTPDRQLAAQVTAELRRWNIVIDDSAGRALNLTPPGAFLLLLAEAAATDWAPVPLLALLKHPLAKAGLETSAFRALVRDLEKAVLRGPRPAPGWAGLRSAVASAVSGGGLRAGMADRLTALLDNLEQRLAALADWQAQHDLATRLAAHLAAAEALAAGGSDQARQSGADHLWRGEAGEALADFVHRLGEAASGQPALSALDYAALLAEMMRSIEVRPRYGAHPRLFIWGPLEARLQQVELMILGGLNDGTWPADPTIDPWLNRPMRQAFGLPQPERRIGLSAHDFQQALGAPQVYLTRALRVEGTPTVPSRWLLRLEAYLRCLGVTGESSDGAAWTAWQTALDRPEKVQPYPRPAPRPGRAHRPKALSVTRIETWMRDPYAIYAQYILRLRALEPIDADPSLADLGTVIHAALERFLQDCRDGLPPDALSLLLRYGEEAFGDILARPAVWAFWWPRFQRIAAWIVLQEQARRPLIAESFTELRGELPIVEVDPPFTLSAVADRIDRMKDGSLAIIDYKTGGIPTMDEIHLGFAPQLPLEAALAKAGAFQSAAGASLRGPVSELAFWQLNGRDSGGAVKPVKEAGRGLRGNADYMVLAQLAYDGLLALLRDFSEEDAAYPAQPAPRYAPRYSDYGHLARVLEWSLAGEEGE
ncbi:double-strand break repair protein AddB [Dongia soli]|uniref:Double-strand break repair protein AddB n=1 Tax=Dongia soli TaxID=600628 RepID=A0ABU5E8J2_9PROT|nr:double-strand break repair protein AddB [Dongia soli]MDY0882364.1 double-strand break repair protein AddB [Dongia soli]